MKIGIGSVVVGNPNTTLDDLVAEVKSVEADGFDFFSLPNIFGHDAISVLSIAGRETTRIELATGVTPTPPRHPFAIAQQALTAQAACKGRFVLGIGLSHKIVIENMLGLSYAQPAKQMREYLEVLMPLAQGKPVAFSGDLYRVNGALQCAGGTPLPVVVAALGPEDAGGRGPTRRRHRHLDDRREDARRPHRADHHQRREGGGTPGAARDRGAAGCADERSGRRARDREQGVRDLRPAAVLPCDARS